MDIKLFLSLQKKHRNGEPLDVVLQLGRDGGMDEDSLLKLQDTCKREAAGFEQNKTPRMGSDRVAKFIRMAQTGIPLRGVLTSMRVQDFSSSDIYQVETWYETTVNSTDDPDKPNTQKLKDSVFTYNEAAIDPRTTGTATNTDQSSSQNETKEEKLKFKDIVTHALSIKDETKSREQIEKEIELLMKQHKSQDAVLEHLKAELNYDAAASLQANRFVEAHSAFPHPRLSDGQATAQISPAITPGLVRAVFFDSYTAGATDTCRDDLAALVELIRTDECYSDGNNSDELKLIHGAVSFLNEALSLCRGGDGYIVKLVELWMSWVAAIDGDMVKSALVPLGFCGPDDTRRGFFSILIETDIPKHMSKVVEMFSVTVCSKHHVSYHPQKLSENGDLYTCPVLTLTNVPRVRLLDPTFSLMLMRLCFTSSVWNTSRVLYEVLLPFLGQSRPLHIAAKDVYSGNHIPFMSKVGRAKTSLCAPVLTALRFVRQKNHVRQQQRNPKSRKATTGAEGDAVKAIEEWKEFKLRLRTRVASYVLQDSQAPTSPLMSKLMGDIGNGGFVGVSSATPAPNCFHLALPSTVPSSAAEVLTTIATQLARAALKRDAANNNDNNNNHTSIVSLIEQLRGAVESLGASALIGDRNKPVLSFTSPHDHSQITATIKASKFIQENLVSLVSSQHHNTASTDTDALTEEGGGEEVKASRASLWAVVRDNVHSTLGARLHALVNFCQTYHPDHQHSRNVESSSNNSEWRKTLIATTIGVAFVDKEHLPIDPLVWQESQEWSDAANQQRAISDLLLLTHWVTEAPTDEAMPGDRIVTLACLFACSNAIILSPFGTCIVSRCLKELTELEEEQEQVGEKGLGLWLTCADAANGKDFNTTSGVLATSPEFALARRTILPFISSPTEIPTINNRNDEYAPKTAAPLKRHLWDFETLGTARETPEPVFQLAGRVLQTCEGVARGKPRDVTTDLPLDMYASAFCVGRTTGRRGNEKSVIVMAELAPEFADLRDIALLFKYVCGGGGRGRSGGPENKESDNARLDQHESSTSILFSFHCAKGEMSATARYRGEYVFGDRVHLRALKSVADPARYLLQESSSLMTSRVDEAGIMYDSLLPTFQSYTSQEESERLLSLLTVPHVRIPAVLHFFATRSSLLFNSNLRAILRAVLLEPHTIFVPDYNCASGADMKEYKGGDQDEENVEHAYDTMLDVICPAIHPHRLPVCSGFSLLNEELRANVDSPVIQLFLTISKNVLDVCNGIAHVPRHMLQTLTELAFIGSAIEGACDTTTVPLLSEFLRGHLLSFLESHKQYAACVGLFRYASSEIVYASASHVLSWAVRALAQERQPQYQAEQEVKKGRFGGDIISTETEAHWSTSPGVYAVLVRHAAVLSNAAVRMLDTHTLTAIAKSVGQHVPLLGEWGRVDDQGLRLEVIKENNLKTQADGTTYNGNDDLVILGCGKLRFDVFAGRVDVMTDGGESMAKLPRTLVSDLGVCTLLGVPHQLSSGTVSTATTHDRVRCTVSLARSSASGGAGVSDIDNQVMVVQVDNAALDVLQIAYTHNDSSAVFLPLGSDAVVEQDQIPQRRVGHFSLLSPPTQQQQLWRDHRSNETFYGFEQGDTAETTQQQVQLMATFNGGLVIPALGLANSKALRFSACMVEGETGRRLVHIPEWMLAAYVPHAVLLGMQKKVQGVSFWLDVESNIIESRSSFLESGKSLIVLKIDLSTGDITRSVKDNSAHQIATFDVDPPSDVAKAFCRIAGGAQHIAFWRSGTQRWFELVRLDMRFDAVSVEVEQLNDKEEGVYFALSTSPDIFFDPERDALLRYTLRAPCLEGFNNRFVVLRNSAQEEFVLAATLCGENLLETENESEWSITMAQIDPSRCMCVPTGGRMGALGMLVTKLLAGHVYDGARDLVDLAASDQLFGEEEARLLVLLGSEKYRDGQPDAVAVRLALYECTFLRNGTDLPKGVNLLRDCVHYCRTITHVNPRLRLGTPCLLRVLSFALKTGRPSIKKSRMARTTSTTTATNTNTDIATDTDIQLVTAFHTACVQQQENGRREDEGKDEASPTSQKGKSGKNKTSTGSKVSGKHRKGQVYIPGAPAHPTNENDVSIPELILLHGGGGWHRLQSGGKKWTADALEDVAEWAKTAQIPSMSSGAIRKIDKNGKGVMVLERPLESITHMDAFVSGILESNSIDMAFRTLVAILGDTKRPTGVGLAMVELLATRLYLHRQVIQGTKFFEITSFTLLAMLTTGPIVHQIGLPKPPLSKRVPATRAVSFTVDLMHALVDSTHFLKNEAKPFVLPRLLRSLKQISTTIVLTFAEMTEQWFDLPADRESSEAETDGKKVIGTWMLESDKVLWELLTPELTTINGSIVADKTRKNNETQKAIQQRKQQDSLFSELFQNSSVPQFASRRKFVSRVHKDTKMYIQHEEDKQATTDMPTYQHDDVATNGNRLEQTLVRLNSAMRQLHGQLQAGVAKAISAAHVDAPAIELIARTQPKLTMRDLFGVFASASGFQHKQAHAAMVHVNQILLDATKLQHLSRMHKAVAALMDATKLLSISRSVADIERTSNRISGKASNRANDIAVESQEGQSQALWDVVIELVVMKRWHACVPRYMVYEYEAGFLMRRVQVDMLQQALTSEAGKPALNNSSCRQVKMGDGKSSVIFPLASLAITNSYALTVLVVPDPLIQMSAEMLTRGLGGVFRRRCVRFRFSRYTLFGDAAIIEARKLHDLLISAKASRHVVLTSASSLKALVLQFVDQVRSSNATTTTTATEVKIDPLTPSLNVTQILAQILSLFKNARLLLDECDVLLHPLRSELNFPTGPERAPAHRDWRVSIAQFALNAVFASSDKSPLTSIVASGIRKNKLEATPHLVLVDQSFYVDELLEPLALELAGHLWTLLDSPDATLTRLHVSNKRQQQQPGQDDSSDVATAVVKVVTDSELNDDYAGVNVLRDDSDDVYWCSKEFAGTSVMEFQFQTPIWLGALEVTFRPYSSFYARSGLSMLPSSVIVEARDERTGRFDEVAKASEFVSQRLYVERRWGGNPDSTSSATSKRAEKTVMDEGEVDVGEEERAGRIDRVRTKRVRLTMTGPARWFAISSARVFTREPDEDWTDARKQRPTMRKQLEPFMKSIRSVLPGSGSRSNSEARPPTPPVVSKKVNATGSREYVLAQVLMESDPVRRKQRALEECQLDQPSRVIVEIASAYLNVFLPHCLSKINSVTHGLIRGERSQGAESGIESNTRKYLSVPFVGKDTPATASEFSHPDILILLSLLAYRHGGLRVQDVSEVVALLKRELISQPGPILQRPACLAFARMVDDKSNNNSSERDVGSSEVDVDSTDDAVLPLHLFQASDPEQLTNLWRQVRFNAVCIDMFCKRVAFPRCLKHRTSKLTATGEELLLLVGATMGISGTPNSALPREMGECQWEPMTEGRFITTLSDSHVVQVMHSKLDVGICTSDQSSAPLPVDWTPASLLSKVARTPGLCALVDTGALVTGYSNREVAEFLLRVPGGLDGMLGVVFLDELDRKMIMLRHNVVTDTEVGNHDLHELKASTSDAFATNDIDPSKYLNKSNDNNNSMGSTTVVVMPLEACAVAVTQRFVYYDQVHCTGMDIAQPACARAAITIGKDMSFRDYAQGAYRMRRLGKGQTMFAIWAPSVEQLMRSRLSRTALAMLPPPQRLVAFLMLNGLRLLNTQEDQLMHLQLATVWRRVALQQLVALSLPNAGISKSNSTLAVAAVGVFASKLSFEVGEMENPSLSETVKKYDSFVVTDQQKKTIKEILQEQQESLAVSATTSDTSAGSGRVRRMLHRVLRVSPHRLDAQQQQQRVLDGEQQQEREKEQQAETMGMAVSDQPRAWTGTRHVAQSWHLKELFGNPLETSSSSSRFSRLCDIQFPGSGEGGIDEGSGATQSLRYRLPDQQCRIVVSCNHTLKRPPDNSRLRNVEFVVCAEKQNTSDQSEKHEAVMAVLSIDEAATVRWAALRSTRGRSNKPAIPFTMYLLDRSASLVLGSNANRNVERCAEEIEGLVPAVLHVPSHVLRFFNITLDFSHDEVLMLKDALLKTSGHGDIERGVDDDRMDSSALLAFFSNCKRMRRRDIAVGKETAPDSQLRMLFSK